jgi:hypothetical protein
MMGPHARLCRHMLLQVVHAAISGEFPHDLQLVVDDRPITLSSIISSNDAPMTTPKNGKLKMASTPSKLSPPASPRSMSMMRLSNASTSPRSGTGTSKSRLVHEVELPAIGNGDLILSMDTNSNGIGVSLGTLPGDILRAICRMLGPSGARQLGQLNHTWSYESSSPSLWCHWCTEYLGTSSMVSLASTNGIPLHVRRTIQRLSDILDRSMRPQVQIKNRYCCITFISSPIEQENGRDERCSGQRQRLQRLDRRFGEWLSSTAGPDESLGDHLPPPAGLAFLFCADLLTNPTNEMKR